MTRLTHELRRDIRSDLLAHRFAKDETRLKREEEKLALRVYNAAFTADERRKMRSLPDGWLPAKSYFYVRLSGIRVCLTMAEKQLFLDNRSDNFTVNVQELRDKHDELHAARETLKEQKRNASAEIAAILESVNTVNQLLAAWPEVEPFIKKRAATPSTLPSVKVEEVNAFLGLKAA